MAHHLSADEVLTTTRAVRKRLELDRPVDRSVIEECLAVAQQAPNGGNSQGWRFVVVTDADKRAALASMYRRGFEIFLSTPPGMAMGFGNPDVDPAQRRINESIQYLVAHIERVPVMVIPCIAPRVQGLPDALQVGILGSIMPAAWSFMLAARARGLGTCWTVFHLFHEEEAARLLGIPYAEVMQVALIPVAHAPAEAFVPGARNPVESMVGWDSWA